MLLILLGIIAGSLTTIAGFGGGLFLVVVLSLQWGPLAALSVTSLALLVGNGHRLYLFWRHVDRPVAGPLVLGLLPGSVAGAYLAVGLPASVLHLLILSMTLLALVRLWTRAAWRFPSRALGPSGVVIGAIGATSGGAGLLAGPMLLSSGLSGDRYIATITISAVVMQIGRIAGYGASGALPEDALLSAGLLAVALVIGNSLGRHLRGALGRAHLTRIEYAAPLICAVLAICGLGR